MVVHGQLHANHTGVTVQVGCEWRPLTQTDSHTHTHTPTGGGSPHPLGELVALRQFRYPLDGLPLHEGLLELLVPLLQEAACQHLPRTDGRI